MTTQSIITPTLNAPPHEFDAIIIGAGFSGLYQLHKLRDELGLNVRVLEKGAGIGGTWFWNRYPGARCDSESYYYCYSFNKEIEQAWSWSERYPEHTEIRKYLNFVSDRLDLKRDIQLDTEVKSAAFNEASTMWKVETVGGETFLTRFLITAVGCLSAANVPKFEGLENFKGDWYHTGNWPPEGVDFAGKRVGQIGTGSTGIQLAPVLAGRSQHLTIFQRTANYSIPARNRSVTPEEVDLTRKNYDDVWRRARSGTNGHPFTMSSLSAIAVTDAERRAIYQKAWERGGLRFRASFKDILADNKANETASDFIREKIAEIVKNPELLEKLTPRDHGFATKRPPIDSGYFETFNRDNVSLIDLKAEPIVQVTEKGIRTTKQEYELDIIVFATGFDAFTGPLLRLNLTGSHGYALKEAWAAGPRTYLGLQTPKFPNLFTITGPGSPSVLCNMPIAIEQHVDWITTCIRDMRAQGLTRIEAEPEAAEQWVEQVNAAANATLLPMASSSWYLGANVPGKPRVFMPYAGGFARYTDICNDITKSNYRGFARS
ncbi:NAD(P)/FAD-dependent oxidoreductase [Actimicrobium sp. CCI2.3]|uniref:flavin-containing monooxygenase n=1 Tax=Actimicrobium sp. CCI2.3 TaxID=3048616 RepID=UPI002AB3EC59|nr:NAD(P)/FAD-dependent oxidoreductase [Actimicrobium sp. CCI2.3]MDY7573066.1 NAD(P)/FAD-dependent oxidoreductase [Actimicrobium sp. CCI2.3]MEB0020863.1 NAD(P)/FAD-dependent oxidoreductase [Actimicrobium sp. CCI2.3]